MAFVTTRLLRFGILVHRHLHIQPLRTCINHPGLQKGDSVGANYLRILRNFHSSRLKASEPRKGECACSEPRDTFCLYFRI